MLGCKYGRAWCVAAFVLGGCSADSIAVGANDGGSSGTDGADPAGPGTAPSADDSQGPSGGDDPSTGGQAGFCGDGVVDGDEECDGSDLNAESCEGMGGDGTLTCTDDCTFELCDCTWGGAPPTCVPAVCGNGVAESGEECDGTDLDGQSCDELGAVGILACDDDCTFDTCDCIWEGEPPTCGPPVCGNGWVEDGEACDGSTEGSDGWVPTCTDLLMAPHAGEPACASDCTYDTSGCTLCGNGIVDDGEACDGEGPTCSELGLGVGVAACTAACELDVSACTLCGNGVVDDGEACDGAAIPTTCSDQGFLLGTLSCDNACGLDLSGCSTCGDGIVSGDEPCDPTVPGLCLCSESCIEDAQSCIAVMISEILYAPLADPDAKPGQWIELHNPAATPWDLQGCVFTGDLGIDTFDIDTPLVIEAGGYATLGSGTELELGFTPDFPMPIGVGLFNDGDLVTLTCDGLVIDTVSYDDVAPWPAVAPGTSIALAVLDAGANDDGAAWCSGATAYGPGHLGTPGAANDCP